MRSVSIIQPCACVLSCFSRFRLFATLWTVARQASLSMGFSRQEYWSGLPCHPTGDLPYPGIEPTSPVLPALQADSLPLSHPGSPSALLLTQFHLLMKVNLRPCSGQTDTNQFLMKWNPSSAFLAGPATP